MRGLLIALVVFSSFVHSAKAQDKILSLEEAIRLAGQHYELLKAKTSYAEAALHDINTTRLGRLPEVSFSLQQNFGTLNGLNGLPSGVPGLVTISSGPVATSQNWHTAFGALYISNVDWTIYAFGVQRAKESLAKNIYGQDTLDLRQTEFLQQVKVISAYLNLVAARQYRLAMEKNLERTSQLSDNIHARAESGLIAGVDSSLVNAEMARSRLSLLDAERSEAEQQAQLSIQTGTDTRGFMLDPLFVVHLPKGIIPEGDTGGAEHPVLQYLKSRVGVSLEQEKVLRRSNLPKLSLFGALQDRGSGFGYGYDGNNGDYTHSYWQGISPSRANYMLGIGLTWDLTSTWKTRSQARSQTLLTEGLRHEYLLEKDQLTDQSLLADQQMQNAIRQYGQTPIQLQAASDAYIQKSALYNNGLATIVDVTQALYLLNRAEIDRNVANNAVWQSFLLKTAATGDLQRFFQQL